MRVIADFCIVPMGVGVSVSKYVAACERVLSDAKLDTTLHAYGTNIEGEWDDVFAAIKRCHEAVHAMGAPRITSTVKFGTRTDRDQSMRDKVTSVEMKLQIGDKPSGPTLRDPIAGTSRSRSSCVRTAILPESTRRLISARVPVSIACIESRCRRSTPLSRVTIASLAGPPDSGIAAGTMRASPLITEAGKDFLQRRWIAVIIRSKSA